MKKLASFALATAITVAACSTASDIAMERIVESDESISGVAIDDGEITVEFDESEGGGSLTVGGGEIPDGFPLPVPDGGVIESSFGQGGTFGLFVRYPRSEYEALYSFYEQWVDENADTVLANTKTADPRTDGWIGEIGDASFGASLIESYEANDRPEMMLILNWEE
ncbi:MAG: hypothetical protein U9R51_06900 [Actinomycetota bacterium]|nr:hypothetical protein [Actinomycetota bacterium]